MADTREYKSKPRGSKNYVKVPRYIAIDKLEGKISYGEMVILAWLFLRANPHNGKCTVSNEGLAKELYGLCKSRRRETRINFFNKKMLALKKKNYLYYPNQQGCRSTFEVTLNNYPLINKQYTNTDFMAESENRSQNQTKSTSKAEIMTEVEEEKQKSDDWIAQLEQEFSTNPENQSRSANNSITDNKYISSPTKREYNDRAVVPVEYIPKDNDEERCREIAIWLEEKEMRFILSRLKKFGRAVLEEAYEVTLRDWELGKVRKKAAYFNKVSENIAQKQQAQ